MIIITDATKFQGEVILFRYYKPPFVYFADCPIRRASAFGNALPFHPPTIRDDPIEFHPGPFVLRNSKSIPELPERFEIAQSGCQKFVFNPFCE
ncbi:hypothetical protein CEXT_811881 [Caerostris extrusa]|uniref:Uncharacterized protein n=1 Tax=Caerostris extrusa TaxID=172846 RepID=A0AAV4MNE5_CAEEX|nr:hypothetical protein CEXT_811881 [Caerostris extrusa]